MLTDINQMYFFRDLYIGCVCQKLTSSLRVQFFLDIFLSAAKMVDQVPSVAIEAVLKPSCDLPDDVPKIKGYDFNQGVNLKAVLDSFLTTGFQASSLGLAIQEINRMVRGG